MRQKFDNGEDPLDPESQQGGHGNPFHFHGNPFGGGGGPFQFKFHFNWSRLGRSFLVFHTKLCFRAIKKSFQWSVFFSKKAAEDVLITKSEWTVSKIDFWASRQQFRALLQCFTECKVQYCEGSAILALNPSDWFTTGRQLLLIKRRSSWFQIGSITINQLLLLFRQASSLFP